MITSRPCVLSSKDTMSLSKKLLHKIKMLIRMKADVNQPGLHGRVQRRSQNMMLAYKPSIQACSVLEIQAMYSVRCHK